jgi:outer membrane protein assembly factor BamA
MRLLIYLVIAGSVAVAVATPFLKTAIEKRLVVYLERRASGLMSIPVSIEALRLTLIPSGAQLNCMRIDGGDPSGSPLSGSIERLEVRGEPLGLIGLRPGIIDIDVFRPRFRATIAPGLGAATGDETSAWNRLTAGLAAIPFAWEFSVGDGEFAVEGPGRYGVDLRGIEVELRSRRGFAAAGGKFGFSGGDLRGVPGRWEGLQGEADLELTRDALTIDPLTLRAPGLTLTGEGIIEGGSSPSARGAVRIEMQPGVLAGLLPAGADPRGTLSADLKGAWQGGAASLRGPIDLEGLRLWDVTVDKLHGDLRLDDALHLDGIRMELLGGRGNGAIEAGLAASGEWSARAKVSFASIDLARIVELAGWRGPALTGALSYEGEHAIAGLDPAGLSGSGRLQLSGLYRSPRGVDLPLSASAVVATAGTALRLSEGTLQAGSARAGFAGEFTPDGGLSIRLSGATGDLSELLLFVPPPQPSSPGGPAPIGSGSGTATPAARRASPGKLAPSAGAVRALWRGGWDGSAVRRAAVRDEQGAADSSMRQLEELLGSLGGRWEYDGEIGYSGGALRFDGELRGRDLMVLGEALGTLSAKVTYAGGLLTIRSATLLPPAGGSIRLGGRVGPGEAGSLSLTGEVADFPAAILARLASLDLSVEGMLGGTFAVSGTRQQPEIDFRVEMGALQVAGVPLRSVRGDLTFGPDLIATPSLRLEMDGGTVEVSGGLRLHEGRAAGSGGDDTPARLELAARDIELASLAPLLGNLPLAGRAALGGSIGGSLEAPLGRLTIGIEDLRIWDRGIGSGSIDAHFTPGRLSIEGGIPARNLTVRGELELDEIGRFDLRGSLAGTLIGGEDIVHEAPDGSRLVATGELSMTGAIRRPAGLTATMELSSLQLALPGLEVGNSAPVVARLQDRVLRLEPVELTGPGTRIDLRGDLDLGAGGEVNASARGHFDLALLRTVARQIQATGRGEVGVTLRGARGSPDLRGDLKLDAERVRYTGVGIPIDDLKAHLVFEGDEARVEELRFLVGGGPTVGSGTLALGNPDRQGGLGAIRSGSLRLQGDDIKASVPEGFQSVSDLDLELTIGAAGATLRGRVDLTRGIYSRDFRVGSSLMSNDQGALPNLPPLTGLLGEVKLDCTLSTSGEVALRNNLARIDGEGVLRVGGTVARPEVTGRLTAIEGGRVTLRNVRYRVTQGTLDFDDPLALDPTIEIRAETSVDEYQISLSIRGTADNFDFELSSNPPLPESDIVALLVTGRTLGDVGTQASGFAEGIASAYLAGQLTEELTDQISALSAFDVLTIDPLYVNGQGDPTTRITVGKRITPDLFVTYSDQFGSDQGSIYQLDYSITRDFRFSSVRDADSSIGGDFSYSLRSSPPWLPGLDLPRPGEARGEIASIRIEGDPRFKESRVLRRAKLKPGRHRSRAELYDAVDRLLNFYRGRGYLMTEIRMEDSPSAEGGLHLVLSIDTGPRIGMEFEGIRGREGLRQKAEPIWEEGLFMDEIVVTVRERLEEYIHDRGYLTAEVAATVQRDDEDAFRVLFTVRRGPRAQAERIDVIGVGRLSRDEVLGEVGSSTDTWRSRGIVRGDRLRQDRAAIRKLYLDEGFARVAVPSPEIALDDAGEKAAITFHVEEGPQVVLHGVRFDGAASLAQTDLHSVTGLRAGEPYRADLVEEAIVQLRRSYDHAGFPDARVAVATEILTSRDGYELIDLTFQVSEGLPQRVEEVDVSNNLITREETIRRAVMMKPGDPLSRADIQEGRSRLYRTGSFRGVQIEALPPDAPRSGDDAEEAGGRTDGGPDSAGEQYRPVRVTVQEAGRFRQLYGIGYDSEEKIRGQYEIANRNLFGTGRYLGLQARASDINKLGSIVFRESGLFGGRFDALASAFWQDEELPAFDVQRVGGAIQLSRRVSRATELRYRYSIEDVDVFDPDNLFEGSTLRLSSLDFSASHDTRDNLFNPLHGHYLVGDLQVSGRQLGSDADFSRFYAQIYTFRELFPNTVWAQAVRVGIGVPFGRSEDDPASTGDPQSGMPPTRRFFAGGDTTIRGFELNRVGPLDAAGDPIGGEGLFILNEELRFPIFRRLQGVVFYDAGNVFHTLDEYALRDLRHVIGAGLRFATPIGPFRLEYGRILDPEPDDVSRGEFFISIGQAF